MPGTALDKSGLTTRRPESQKQSQPRGGDAMAPSGGVPTGRDVTPARALRLNDGRELRLGSPPLVMGILNITPDSFSDGGRWLDPSAAIERGMAMVAAGADLLDLGAESTRPGGGVYGGGAETVAADEELARLLPVLEELRRRCDVPLSVDTRKAVVAESALRAGAALINDVSGLEDPAMAAVVATHEAALVIMHSRGDLASMQADIRFDDVLAEVEAELVETARRAENAGVARDRILIDPGIGFGKTVDHNLTLLRHLDGLGAAGYPLLVGASRKSFIGQVASAAVTERLPGSLAAAGWVAHHRAAIVRVHDVAATRQFLEVWQAIARAGEAPEAQP